MFTGIIEALGAVSAIETQGSNRSFWIESALTPDLRIDQSLAHNGVCLTVDALAEHAYRVTAIAETLQKTHLDSWKTGTLINLERCMTLNSRLDGHIVQGHVDTTAVCKNRTDQYGSWLYQFEFPEKFAPLVIEKGSIAVNGISLTLFNVSSNTFSVAIIPYTFEHTNLNQVHPQDRVNIEFDMIGKYVQRLHSLQVQDKIISL